jgi:hypothetical protein
VSIISWIVVGLIAGLLAKLLVPGDDPGGHNRNDPRWDGGRGGRRAHRRGGGDLEPNCGDALSTSWRLSLMPDRALFTKSAWNSRKLGSALSAK